MYGEAEYGIAEYGTLLDVGSISVPAPLPPANPPAPPTEEQQGEIEKEGTSQTVYMITAIGI